MPVSPNITREQHSPFRRVSFVYSQLDRGTSLLMELRFECPHCGQHLSATPEQIGGSAPCPGCAQTFSVPNPLAVALDRPVPVHTTTTRSAPVTSSLPPWLTVRLRQPRYIVLILCTLIWLYQTSHMSTLNEQAAPYIAELQRMNSGGYLTGLGIESFVRGALGDPFGAAHEESDKEASLRSQVAPIAAAYDSASGWRTFAGWVGFFTLCWIGFKHWRTKQLAKNRTA